MSDVGQPERKTQNRVIKLLTKKEADGGLGYTYLGNWQDRPDNSNIEPGELRKYLSGKYSPTLIDKALIEFTKAAVNLSKGLYLANLDVYTLLRYGVKVREEIGENTQTVRLIDWEQPLKNHFAIAEEVTLKGGATKRPDVVLYVNGIALGVLELKGSKVPVAEAIRQNLDNQQPAFIEQFFTTV